MRELYIERVATRDGPELLPATQNEDARSRWMSRKRRPDDLRLKRPKWPQTEGSHRPPLAGGALCHCPSLKCLYQRRRQGHALRVAFGQP